MVRDLKMCGKCTDYLKKKKKKKSSLDAQTGVMSPRRRCITARPSGRHVCTPSQRETTSCRSPALLFHPLHSLPADYHSLPAVFPRPAPFFANKGTEESLQVTPSLCSSPYLLIFPALYWSSCWLIVWYQHLRHKTESKSVTAAIISVPRD